MPSTFADIPENVELSARAARDLKSIHKKNRQEAGRVLDDLIRLAKKTLPASQSKKLSGMGDLWELDSGRYRIVYFWKDKTLFVVTVFPKPDQAKIFRSHRPLRRRDSNYRRRDQDPAASASPSGLAGRSRITCSPLAITAQQ